MRIIPAIDIIDGKCVRLTQGDYNQKKIYNEDPIQVAKEFEAAELTFLHLVDLDGAKAGQVTNWDVVKAITEQTNLVVDFGGGIKKGEDIERLLELGVKQVNLGSIAVKEPELVQSWIRQFGQECIILSADVKDKKIAIHGWQKNSDIDLFEFVKQYQEMGIRYITCTDISTDGMLQGPNVELYMELVNVFPSLKIIASGGVGSEADLDALKATRVDGVIVGKAIYEGKIKIEGLRK